MNFRKEERTCQTPPGWRLATVKEARNYVESIKSQNLLEEWDRARLLDGWIGGSGYEFKAHVGFRSCVGYMLIVESPQQVEIFESDDMGNCTYSEATLLDEEGMSAAFFLCSEDWNIDVICWVLSFWSKSNDAKLRIAKDIEPLLFQEIKDTSDRLNKLARDLHSTRTMKREPNDKFSHGSMAAMCSAIVNSVRKNITANLLKKKVDELDELEDQSELEDEIDELEDQSEIEDELGALEDIGDEIWDKMNLTNDLRTFRRFHFDTTNTSTLNALADIVWSVAADVVALVIIRYCIQKKNKNIYREVLKGKRTDDLALVSSIVVNIDSLLEGSFLDSLWKEVEKEPKAGGGDFKSFEEMLRDRYGTFSYDGHHGVLNKILVQAAKNGKLKLLRRLIEWGVEPLDTDDKRQKTALHHAAKLEDESLGVEIAKELLKGSSSEKLANARDHKERTPLHRAVFYGHVQVCRLLIDHKADVFSKDKCGQIPLHYALREPNEEVIRILFSVDAQRNNLQVDSKDDKGETPLDLAVEDEDINLVAWLLSLSRLPEAYFDKLDLALYLRESSARGYPALVSKLLKAGANPLERDQEGKTAVHYAVECQEESLGYKIVRDLYKYDRELLKACDKYGRSVLHIAAFVGHKEICRWLLSLDLGVDTADRDGQRALYYAAAGTQDDEDLLDVLIFEYYGMRSTNVVDLRDSRGTTLLHVAAAKGKVKMVGRLLSKRLIPKTQDREKFVRAEDVIGQTALHKAASGGHRKVVQKLLDNGAHALNERDSDGKTALHYAAQAEKIGNGEDALEIGKLLLKKCNIGEKSLLLFAFAVGIGSADESLESSSKLKNYLVKEKDTVKENNDNLLRVAATLGNIDMTRELLSRGAKIADIRNKDWREDLKDKGKSENVKNVLKQIDNIVEQGTDKPALQDTLGRIGFANGLAALFLNPFVKSPITVGISGEWGMGKSSVMAQTESILLKTSAYVTFSTFSNSSQHENFPGAKKPKLSQKGERQLNRIKNSIKQLSSKQLSSLKKIFMQLSRVKKIFMQLSSKLSRMEKKIMNSSSTPVEESDPLNEFLKNYQPQYEKVYKSLAAMDRKDLFVSHEEEEGTIPSILTVRYNAWEYRNESEAWAGLAVVITKELEAAMPVAQRLCNSWRYNWKYNKQRIFRDVIFPCLLVVILALWFTIIFWILLERTSSEKFKDLKYGSFPITFIIIVWAGVKSVMSVVKPVSSQMIEYLCLPDHSAKLGYQQKVIEDINFLKDEALSHRPINLWKAFALIWCLIAFCWDERYVHLKTRMLKMTPAFEDQLRIVVFVDDLDRCEENVILKVLSAINLVLAVCKIDVILGMDKSMIERAVRRKFEDKNNNPRKSSEDLADKYLRKIVQLPLDLPDPSHFESRKFLLGHLGMLDTSKEVAETDTDPAPKEKEKMNPKFRIGRRNPNTAQEETRVWGGRERNGSSDTAGGADSPLSDNNEQPDTRESNQRGLQEGKLDIVTDQHGAGHTQESGVPMGDKGLMRCFRKWISYLSSMYTHGKNTQSQGKKKPTPENEDQGNKRSTLENNIPIEMIIPKYTEGEGKAFQDLQTKATGSRKLPREWKRLLNYHRLAWNILSKRPDVTKLDGWQVQLIAWMFVCSEWRDQINTLIQEWHKLDVLTKWVTHHQHGEAESSGPSLREIVEDYTDGRRKGNTAKPGRVKKSAIDIHESNPSEKATTIPMSKELDANYIKGVVREVLKEEREQEQREQEQEHSLKLKEVEGSEKEELEDGQKTVIRKVVQEEIRKVVQEENLFKEVIKKVLAEEKEQEGQQNFRDKECDEGKRIVVGENITEENSLNQERENKEKTSHLQKGKGMIKVKEAKQEDEKEREEVKEAEQEDEKESEKIKEKEQEEEKERDEWRRLRNTLSKYNVSMDGIQAFQNFRFHCVAGYLPWPLPEE